MRKEKNLKKGEMGEVKGLHRARQRREEERLKGLGEKLSGVPSAAVLASSMCRRGWTYTFNYRFSRRQLLWKVNTMRGRVVTNC